MGTLADTLKESIAHMKAIERGEAPPLPVRYPSPGFDPAESEFVFETDDDEEEPEWMASARAAAEFETHYTEVARAEGLDAAFALLKIARRSRPVEG